GALLGQGDQGIGFGLKDQLGAGARVAEGHLLPVDPVTGPAAPERDALAHRLDGNQALRAALAVPAAADQAVDADHVMPGSREMQRGSPTEIAVDPEDDDGFLTHQRTRMLAREHEMSMRPLSAGQGLRPPTWQRAAAAKARPA